MISNPSSSSSDRLVRSEPLRPVKDPGTKKRKILWKFCRSVGRDTRNDVKWYMNQMSAGTEDGGSNESIGQEIDILSMGSCQSAAMMLHKGTKDSEDIPSTEVFYRDAGIIIRSVPRPLPPPQSFQSMDSGVIANVTSHIFPTPSTSLSEFVASSRMARESVDLQTSVYKENQEQRSSLLSSADLTFGQRESILKETGEMKSANVLSLKSLIEQLQTSSPKETSSKPSLSPPLIKLPLMPKAEKPTKKTSKRSLRGARKTAVKDKIPTDKQGSISQPKTITMNEQPQVNQLHRAVMLANDLVKRREKKSLKKNVNLEKESEMDPLNSTHLGDTVKRTSATINPEKSRPLKLLGLDLQKVTPDVLDKRVGPGSKIQEPLEQDRENTMNGRIALDHSGEKSTLKKIMREIAPEMQLTEPKQKAVSPKAPSGLHSRTKDRERIPGTKCNIPKLSAHLETEGYQPTEQQNVALAENGIDDPRKNVAETKEPVIEAESSKPSSEPKVPLETVEVKKKDGDDVRVKEVEKIGKALKTDGQPVGSATQTTGEPKQPVIERESRTPLPSAQTEDVNKQIPIASPSVTNVTEKDKPMTQPAQSAPAATSVEPSTTSEARLLKGLRKLKGRGGIRMIVAVARHLSEFLVLRQKEGGNSI
ncbi:unnamed protein product [Echinostoma caproni]|uniref:Flocculation protein FLO11-like n=1 Tax=Echinostoma caproni TaxID=27848 RepID=A0A183B0A1_9TREM|nr:unnamed protein product [Echinostoma caproni]